MAEPTMYDLPDDVADTLRCSHCNTYLSCGPVKLHADGSTTCGRCSQPSNEASTSQALFEIAMAKFTFPCRYKHQGCKKRVLFNHAVEHEPECAYRTVCCPSLPYNSCLKDVSVFDVQDHFKEAHADLVLKEGKFKLEFKQDVQCNLIMAEANVIVFVQYFYDSLKKILYFDVKHFSQDGKENVSYKLQFISGCDPDNTVNLKERKCDLYESHAINMQTAAHFIMDNYLPVLENPNFIYVKLKLTVVNKCPPQNIVPSVTLTTSQSLDEYEEKARAAWDALEYVRCAGCYSFIVPPVFVLTNVHANAVTQNSASSTTKYYCNECKPRAHYNRSVHFTETKIEIKDYPCRWRDCTFMGNDSNIAQHVESCQFRAEICPVSSCKEGYYTLNNLMEHMQCHGTYCPNPKRIVIDLFHSSSYVGFNSIDNTYFTLLENRVIIFTCSMPVVNQWYLKGNTENLTVAIYFEHGHCRFKSKTYTFNNQMLDMSNNSSIAFPKCFKSCKCISAILNIANKIK